MRASGPVSHERWQLAQRVQRSYQTAKSRRQTGFDRRVIAGAMARSIAAERRLAGHGPITEGPVIEVGSGSRGLIWCWPTDRLRIAVDPLAGFYRTHFPALQEGPVVSCQASGEELPLPAGFATVLLSDNVIDHVRDPRRFLGELRRVADDEALAYITAHVHHPAWDLASRLFNLIWSPTLARHFPGFSGHPFHFTRRSLETLIREAGFVPLEVDLGPPEAAPKNELGPLRALARRVFFKNRRLEVVARAG